MLNIGYGATESNTLIYIGLCNRGEADIYPVPRTVVIGAQEVHQLAVQSSCCV